MYHGKIVDKGITIEVELGVVNSQNKEHLANIHLHIIGFGHIRGIMAYQKPDGIVLRMPGYLKNEADRYKTSYLVLDQDVVKAIAQIVRTTPKDKMSKSYEGPKTWSIWGPENPKSRDEDEVTVEDPYFV